MNGEKKARHLRALFIPDVHLGTRGCQADLLRKARKGVRIMYVPDKHDEFLRTYFATHFGGIELQDTAIHETADEKRLLVIHGDQFDIVVRHAKWLALFGDWAYVMALAINTHFNRLRRKRGFSFWSLSSWAKMQVKNAVSFIGAFEAALVGEANKLGVDGVVCGHIHYAVIHDRAGVGYMNCGDWVESCTALVESHDGSFEIIRWADCAASPTAPEETESEHQAAA